MNTFVNIPDSKYQINKLGQVRRIYKNGNISYLKPTLGNNGYLSITLDNRKKKNIHRLLGICFIDNPDNCPLINHIDRNRLNNNIDNLRWTTHKVNCNNSIKQINKKGSLFETKDKVKGKIYYGYRSSFYKDNIKYSKRFKKKEDAQKWLDDFLL